MDAGMRTADVIVENNLSDWLTQAIKMEMEKSGYKVTIANNNSASTSDLVLGGEILNVYCTALMTYEGEVSFFAQLKREGKEIMRKRYTGKGSAGLNWAASSSGYGSSLAEALSVAIRDLVEDVNGIITEKNL